jgi:hypothetical protein
MKLFRFLWHIWAGLIVPLALLAQNDTGIIAGVVTNSVTGEPIVGASVRLIAISATMPAGSSQTAPSSVTSLDDGSFRFDAVAPGSYFVTASRQDFVASQYGLLKQPTRPVTVQAGQTIGTVSIQLIPQSMLTGKVVDDKGKPVAKAEVQAFMAMPVRGQSRLALRSRATTNDAGEYQIQNVTAGKYYVLAQPQRQNPAEGQENTDLQLIRTFYPDAADSESATPVEVTTGQNLSGITVRLRRAATYHIRGKISGSTPGSGKQTLRVFLSPRNAIDLFNAGTAVQPDEKGEFDISDVTAGNYTLRLTGNVATRQHVLATQDVDVGSNDVNSLVLAIVPPLKLTGHIRIESNDQVDLSRTNVYLGPSGNVSTGGFQPAKVNANGEFELSEIDPGQYVLHIEGLPAGTYANSVLLNQQDMSGKELDLSQGGQGQLEIVVRSGAGQVDGTLQSNPTPQSNLAVRPVVIGSMMPAVVLVPQTALADGRALLIGGTNPARTFSIPQVPPGHYSAFAVEQLDYNLWQNPDFIRLMQSRGVSVDVQENDRKQVQLSMIPLSDIQQVMAQLGLRTP